MDNDSYSCLVEFDANYSHLIEQCFRPNNGPTGARTQPRTEPGTVTTRPQGKTQSVPAARGTTKEASGAATAAAAAAAAATTTETAAAATGAARHR